MMVDGEERAGKEGLRRIAYFCSYVPEEILSVPGLYAYRMRAPNNVTTEVDNAAARITFGDVAIKIALEDGYRVATSRANSIITCQVEVLVAGESSPLSIPITAVEVA